MGSSLTTYSLASLVLLLLPVTLAAQQDAPLLLAGHGVGTRHASFSPDGRTVVSVGNNDTIHFWNAFTGELLRSFRESRPGHSVFYRPDGEEVIRAGDSTLQARNAITGQMRLWFTFDDRHGSKFAIYSPDGTSFLTLGVDFTPELWSTANGALIHRFEGHTASPIDGRFSPDGTRIATVSNVDRTLRIWSVASGEELARYTATSYIFSLDWTADGTGVMVTADSAIVICDASTGHITRTIAEKTLAIEARFLEGSQYVVASSADSNLTLYDAAEGNVIRTLLYRDGFPGHIEVNPARSQIAVVYTNGKIGLWELGFSSVSDPSDRIVAGESYSSLRSLSPNPAQDHLEISFDLSTGTSVRLSLVDAAGREVALLTDGRYESGRHLVQYDVDDLPPGAYYCVLQTDQDRRLRSVHVVR